MSHFGNHLKDILASIKTISKLGVEYWRRSPTNKFIILNTGIYLMWKISIIPQDFLVKHFSAQRFNFENGRLHTLLTYSISHTKFFSYFFDLLMVGILSRNIQNIWGNKHLYWLYGLGALFGGLSTVTFKPPTPFIQPVVGSDSITAALLMFLGVQNPQQIFILLTIPCRVWVLLVFMGIYSLAYDPHKRVFSGMTAGLVVYQMCRARFI